VYTHFSIFLKCCNVTFWMTLVYWFSIYPCCFSYVFTYEHFCFIFCNWVRLEFRGVFSDVSWAGWNILRILLIPNRPLHMTKTCRHSSCLGPSIPVMVIKKTVPYHYCTCHIFLLTYRRVRRHTNINVTFRTLWPTSIYVYVYAV